MINLLIGDTFFKQNPDKILGTQSMRKGRFDSDIIVVDGDISSLNKIDTPAVAIADDYPQQVFASESKEQVIEQVFENEAQKEKKRKIRTLRTGNASPDVDNRSNQEVYTHAEISEQYNKHISREELEAYYMSHPEFNHRLLFDNFTFTKDELVDKGLLCYEDNKLTYVFTFQSGNVAKKASNMQRDKERFIDQHGMAQYERQLEMLSSVKPKPKGFVGDEKIIMLPHSSFAKEFKIKELRFGPELSYEQTLANAFRRWLYHISPEEFKKSNAREVIDYYLDNNSIPISDASKEAKERDERNAINMRQRTKEDGDMLFSKFLAEDLLPEDQAKLSFLWNEKFNSIVEPDLTKIPVCFRLSKTFKGGAPLMLNPTQRQGVAFQTEKFSGLFAYGVGVGKTLASIAAVSQAIDNGFSRKPLFVVPTNTYDKWIGEIQGYTDKETGIFMHGALPHLPPVVGLFNLNPVIVRDKLKIYSDKDEKTFEAIEEAINALKRIEKKELSEVQKKHISGLYAVNWVGMESQYDNYLSFSKAKKPLSFIDYVADYLKDEYNYLIYSLGKIKDFPAGTIFVTTEVGLQRLGVSDANKESLKSTLYTILSQGENTSEDNNRDAAKLEVKIDQTISSSLKNAKINIEDLGIDLACFDEGHLYKKLFTYVKGTILAKNEDGEGNVKYKREKSKYELKSGQFPSARALSAMVLSHYIQKSNNGRNVIQLTATPFTNSPLEVYSMLVLTNYEALENVGAANMVDFFDTFMRINYDIKYTPQKTVVKDVVLTGYNNLSQLRSLIYSLMDKKDEGANLLRPTKHIWPSIQKGIETTIPMTAEQEELMAEVKAYIQGKNDAKDICASALQDELESTDYDGLEDEALITEWERVTQKEYDGEREDLPESKRENLIKQIKATRSSGMEIDESQLSDDESAGVRILKALSMMRQITLSPYLYYKACSQSAGGKAAMPSYIDYVHSSPKFKYVMGCIASVINFHKQRNERISGQVIYMNAGVEYFPLLKEYLVKKVGLNESQVGMVTGGMSKNAKEVVKRRFLSGDILVLIGSSTISVGVDLQDNASCLYNCYYDWNPTDAQQIEGRIWRQGNRFANVRLCYPQCYNSADPILFEYLNQKTLRINEIWNRSSTAQEIDLRDFDPKQLQKQLITDPEEKADWEILEQTDSIQSQIIYFENRKQSLEDAMYSYREYKNLRPQVIEALIRINGKKLEAARKEAVTNQRNKLNDIIDKYDDADKQAKEIQKFKESRYDYENDPERKYKAFDYETADDERLYADAGKAYDLLKDLGYSNASDYDDVFADRRVLQEVLRDFRSNFKETRSAQERIMKPLGLSFENALNPTVQLHEKLEELQQQLTSIYDSRQERIERFKMEMLQNAHRFKTVDERIAEWEMANASLLPPQLLFTPPDTTGHIEKPTMEELQAYEPVEERLDIPQPQIIIAKPVEPTHVTTAVASQPVVAVAEPLTVITKDIIQKQINALNLALKFADTVEKIKIRKKVKALEISKKYANA